MNEYSLIHYPFIYLGFVILHVLCGEGLSAYLYKRRFKKNPLIYLKEKNTHARISRILIIPVLFWFISFCLYAFSSYFRLLFNPFEINPIYGWILGVIGLIGMIFCQYQMGEAFRVGQEENNQRSQLIICLNGAFRYTRNPIYLFSLLYLLGVSLWAPIWPIWVSYIIIIILLHRLILSEEAFLTERFDERYLAYKKSVPRYWPI